MKDGWDSPLGQALIDDLDKMVMGDLVMADSWDADELDVPELYDTDQYDGWDEENFG